MYDRARGFSLVELMIVVSIIAILTSIAYPSYRQHVMRSHRGDATAALLRVASDQEKYYIQNNSYGEFDELGSPTTEHGWYELDVTGADATTFEATATAVGGGQQDDEDCQVFTINAEGQRTAKNASDADSTDLCW